MLPKPVQIKFQSLFDDAPQVPYSVVESVFRSEFGRPPSGPDGVFEIFEEQAVASASIAQVHKAKLRGSDQWVAVKIQKPDVVRQTWWDLTTYKGVMWLYDRWFELPVYFLVDYISDHLRQELDFIREADNARRTAASCARTRALRSACVRAVLDEAGHYSVLRPVGRRHRYRAWTLSDRSREACALSCRPW